MIDFAYPWLLLLLLLVPLIAYYCVFRQKQPSVTGFDGRTVCDGSCRAPSRFSAQLHAACALCAYCRPRPSPGR